MTGGSCGSSGVTISADRNPRMDRGHRYGSSRPSVWSRGRT